MYGTHLDHFTYLQMILNDQETCDLFWTLIKGGREICPLTKYEGIYKQNLELMNP